MKNSKIKVALTFDAEEFDIPLEYGLVIDENLQHKISAEGLKKIIQLLKKHDIQATFFVTANFAIHHKKEIKAISKKHEIALHGYYHFDNYTSMSREKIEKRLKNAKQIIEKIINKKIIGFRAPRMQFKEENYDILKKIGLKYDSSLNPIFIPGRYNNIFKPRKPFIKKGIVSFPLATSLFCLPLFWIAFRNLGINYAKICTKLSNLNKIVLIFHPWEFTDLSRFKIPFYFKRNAGKKILSMLDEYIAWCKNNKLEFVIMSRFVNLKNQVP
jgi:peptidoglycan/xylan/chitin deacetylase (PgdA/CDA1 family)